jgi:hypothetical protein
MHENEVVAALVAFDERVNQVRLAGPGGDTALDLLAQLHLLAPEDPRVRQRGELLAGLFLTLARAAESRGDLGEAAAHYQAAIEASAPSEAREGLARVEEAVRSQSRAEAQPQ